MKKIGLSLQWQVRNKQCPQRNERSLSSSYENCVSSCQWLFDWLISEQQSVNPRRELISILSGKYKIFTFVHPVQDRSTGNPKTIARIGLSQTCFCIRGWS